MQRVGGWGGSKVQERDDTDASFQGDQGERLNDKKIRFRLSPLMICAVHLGYKQMERKRFKDKKQKRDQHRKWQIKL